MPDLPVMVIVADEPAAVLFESVSVKCVFFVSVVPLSVTVYVGVIALPVYVYVPLTAIVAFERSYLQV